MTIRYDSSLIAGAVRLSAGLGAPGPLKPCPDSALTAFAELAALRLGVSHAFISLFDSQHEYVVAEATPTLPLRLPSLCDQSAHVAGSDPQLLLCGLALPRSLSICERVLLADSSTADSDDNGLPVALVPDIVADTTVPVTRFSSRFPGSRFFAGTPIRTPRGINIGVLYVLGDEPRTCLDAVSVQLLRDLSVTVMGYLSSRRHRHVRRRADRMLRGIGSFVEGEATTSNWQDGHDIESFRDVGDGEGSLNSHQQHIRRQEAEVRTMPEDGTQQSALTRQHTFAASAATFAAKPSRADVASVQSASEDGHVKRIFSKAANIIRESIEVEGAVFVDASISTFGGLAVSSDSIAGNPSSPSAGDESHSRSSSDGNEHTPEPVCQVLGFSTSLSSSIDGSSNSAKHVLFPEKVLRRMLRHYPKGIIFNLDENGSLQSSDLSSDDGAVASQSSAVQVAQSPGEAVVDDAQGARRRRRRVPSRNAMVQAINAMFPGARSVAFFPAWDAQNRRWFAGGFAYTTTPTRVFSVEGELSYLEAFGAVCMAEVLRTETRLADKSKTNVLNSLSHEFRSPLHGVVLGVELLRDTSLDAFQGNVMRTVEACSGTLLDTVDHLMDWSKINHFMSTSAAGLSGAARPHSKRGLRNSNKMTIEAGMMSIAADVNLDALTEEVVEAVSAGHSLQMLSAGRIWSGQQSEGAVTDALRQLDSMRAIESMSPRTAASGNNSLSLGKVAVSIDIMPGVSWAFRAQPGAIRRILMNLVGNSLKYTTDGFVKISLAQQVASSGESHGGLREIKLTVTDSGCGMSEDYLANDIFTPFAQEDNLRPGTGLGLSLVKRIVTALGGSIRIRSQAGKGTTASVRLSLEPLAPGILPSPSPFPAIRDDFETEAQELAGLRVQLFGYKSQAVVDGVFGASFNELEMIGSICRDWLHMQVVEPSENGTLSPEVLLYEEHSVAQHLLESQGRPAAVICRSALSARRLAAQFRQSSSGPSEGLFEFVSQPYVLPQHVHAFEMIRG